MARCCTGYASNMAESECIPVCSNPCIHGVCSAPDKCKCESGFYGEQCDKRKLKGLWQWRFQFSLTGKRGLNECTEILKFPKVPNLKAKIPDLKKKLYSRNLQKKNSLEPNNF